jgi:molybdopterin-guanine dinucleotide biosynthesis protein A
MRILAAFLGAVASAGLLAVPVSADSVTVRGEVVDLSCAIEKGAAGKGEAHSACALTCAREGQPVGILTDDSIYQLTGDFTASKNARLLDFIAKVVTITGEVIERDGKKLLNVKTIRVAN